MQTDHTIQDEFEHNRSKVIILIFAIFLLSILILLGVKSSSKEESPATESKETMQIIFEDNGHVPTLQMGHYALWGRSGEEKFFLKRFNSINGKLISLDGNKLSKIELPRKQIDSFFVSAEPEGDRDETPSQIILAQGVNENGASTLRQDIPPLEESAKGAFILSTPTDGNQLNESSGIWFSNSTKDRASLEIPRLTNTSYCWSSWIEKGQTLINLGMFKDPGTKDNSDKYSDTTATGYNFPGEDLLKNLDTLEPPLNLGSGSYTASLTIEPCNNDLQDFTGEARFIKVFELKIPENSKPNTEIELINVFSPFNLNIEVVNNGKN